MDKFFFFFFTDIDVSVFLFIIYSPHTDTDTDTQIDTDTHTDTYIYCHPQTDCFVLSELFSVARPAGRSKPGSKPVQLYDRLRFQTTRLQDIYRLRWFNCCHSKLVIPRMCFICFMFCLLWSKLQSVGHFQ